MVCLTRPASSSPGVFDLNPNDVDIFGYDEGGPVGQMKRRRDPDRDSDPLITPAQIAYYASQFAPGTGIYDASGRMAAPP